jgi:hypothetical protein
MTQPGDPMQEPASAADAALVAALSGPPPAEPAGQLTLAEVAERAGIPLALAEAIEREGFLVPHGPDQAARYTPADVDAVRAGWALLEAGVPLAELLDLARRFDTAMRGVADHAVEVFLRFVRDPVHAAAEQEAAERLVAAYRQMLPATTTVVAHHFRQVLLASARSRLEASGER